MIAVAQTCNGRKPSSGELGLQGNNSRHKEKVLTQDNFSYHRFTCGQMLTADLARLRRPSGVLGCGISSVFVVYSVSL